jgi:hypothetical protein
MLEATLLLASILDTGYTKEDIEVYVGSAGYFVTGCWKLQYFDKLYWN